MTLVFGYTGFQVTSSSLVLVMESNANETGDLSYGVPHDNPSDFQEVAFEYSVFKFVSYMHAAHGAIYSKCDDLLWSKYKIHALMLMQMRSDGNIGFGGGILDNGLAEGIINCLNREYKEEFNLDLEKCAFTQSDHIVTYVNHKKKLVAHMFAHEIEKKLFLDIEKSAPNAKDWGLETFGTIRVPLFVVDFDNLRGLPVFLANQFAGCAKMQLIETLKRRDIIPENDLDFAIACHKNYVNSTISASK